MVRSRKDAVNFVPHKSRWLVACWAHAPLLALSPAGRGDFTKRPSAPGARPDSLFLVRREMEPIQRPKFPAHICDPRLRRQRPPRRPLEQLIRCELAPVLVHVALQPAKQVSKLAPLDLVIEIGHL